MMFSVLIVLLIKCLCCSKILYSHVLGISHFNYIIFRGQSQSINISLYNHLTTPSILLGHVRLGYMNEARLLGRRRNLNIF